MKRIYTTAPLGKPFRIDITEDQMNRAKDMQEQLAEIPDGWKPEVRHKVKEVDGYPVFISVHREKILLDSFWEEGVQILSGRDEDGYVCLTEHDDTWIEPFLVRNRKLDDRITPELIEEEDRDEWVELCEDIGEATLR